jgi:hypothetical protein
MTGCSIHSVAMERVQGKKLPVFLFCSPHGHACKMGASMNSNLNLSVFTKLSNFDHVFLY